MPANITREAELWGELYALLCLYPSIRSGLASMPDADKPKLDDLAEQIIASSRMAKGDVLLMAP